jgi:LysM repeat protein
VITSTPDYDGNIYHVVQNGQTLYTIATYYGVGYETIKELNQLTSNFIYVGDKLLISKKPTPTITLTRTPRS